MVPQYKSLHKQAASLKYGILHFSDGDDVTIPLGCHYGTLIPERIHGAEHKNLKLLTHISQSRKKIK